MNWRQWIYEQLISDPQVTELVPAGSIYGSGSIGAPPASKPFLIIRMDPTQVGRSSAWSVANATIWAHDEPGDFGRIDEVLLRVRRALNRKIPGQPGGITVEWSGDSTDLADDGYGTISRNASYRLITLEEVS
jgi:hypothetical protein